MAPWEAAFVRGTSPADVPADLDPMVLVRAFHAAQEAMAARWEAVTPEDLARPFARTLPDGSNTVGGAVNFMVWHETYHLGQLGFMRRLAGKAGAGVGRFPPVSHGSARTAFDQQGWSRSPGSCPSAVRREVYRDLTPSRHGPSDPTGRWIPQPLAN